MPNELHTDSVPERINDVQDSGIGTIHANIPADMPREEFPVVTVPVANEVSKKNLELKAELWKRGYYVQEVGQTCCGEVDYLIVSCVMPRPKALKGALPR